MAVKSILAKLLGLFVDDGYLAAATLAWLGFCWLSLPRMLGVSGAAGPILFLGLAVIMAASALRRSRHGP